MNLEKKIRNMDQQGRDKLLEKIDREGERYGIYPLTSDQYLFWCRYRAKQPMTHYVNLGVEFCMKNISHKQLMEIINQLRFLQNTFRYRFVEINGRVFQYMNEDSELSVTEYDVSNESTEEAGKHIEEYRLDFYNTQSFDLQNDAPVRFEIIKEAENEFRFLLCMDHIISDTFSVGVVYRNIIDIINGNVVKSDYQYENRVTWLNSEAGRKIEFENYKYFEKTIEHIDKYLNLPTDYSRYSNRSDHEDSVIIPVKGTPYEGIKNRIRATRSNFYVVAASAFSLVLQMYARKKEVIMATTLFNRNKEEHNDIVGSFASFVPIVYAADAEITFDKYIEINMKKFKEAMEHGTHVASNLLDAHPYERIENVFPIYQVVFVYHSSSLHAGIDHIADGIEMKLGDLNSKNMDHFALDICIKIDDLGDFCYLTVSYCSKLFKRKTIQHLMDVYSSVLQHLDELGGKKLKDITLVEAEDCSEKVLKTTYPLKGYQLFENEINDCFTYVYGNEKLSILDEYRNPVPENFFGYIYITENNVWYETGKTGKINLNQELIVDESRSQVVDFEGKIIDLKKSEQRLKDAVKNIQIKFDYINSEQLVLNYSQTDERITYRKVSSICDFCPSLIYKTNRFHQKSIQQHQKNVLNILKILKNDSNQVIAIQAEESEEVHILITDVEKPEPSFISDLYDRTEDDRITIYYHEKAENTDWIEDEYFTDDLYRYHRKDYSPTQKKLIHIWEVLLGTDNFGIYDCFYEVGGSSVTLYKLMLALKQEFDMDVDASQLLVNNTVSKLAALVDAYQKKQGSVFEI